MSDKYYIEAMKEINLSLGIDEWDGIESEKPLSEYHYRRMGWPVIDVSEDMIIEYKGRMIKMAGRTSSTGPR